MDDLPPPPPRRRRPGCGRVAARAVAYVVAELLIYLVVVACLVYLVSVWAATVPFPGITTTPETAVINEVGLSLQSVKHLLFEDALSTLYAPSPPPQAVDVA